MKVGNLVVEGIIAESFEEIMRKTRENVVWFHQEALNSLRNGDKTAFLDGTTPGSRKSMIKLGLLEYHYRLPKGHEGFSRYVLTVQGKALLDGLD